MQFSAMDQASICSSSDLSLLSDGISNDTFDIISSRGRQDMMVLDNTKLESPLIFTMESPRCASAFVCHTSQAVINSAPLPCLVDAAPDSIAPPPTKKRRVNFDDCEPRIINEESHSEETITYDDMRARWWSQDDLDFIKQGAKEMSIRLRKQAKERGCVVEMAHKKTSLMLTNNFPELVKLTPTTPDQDLRHWCVRSDGRRGLERFASREYGNMRKDDVTTTRNAVFEEQARQRQQQGVNAEALAKVSKEKSRRARTFSLFMGEADALAATATATSSSRGSSKKRCKTSRRPSSSPVRSQAPLLRSAA